MKKNVYVVITTESNYYLWDYHNDCHSEDVERYVIQVVGVYSTYDKAKSAALRAREHGPDAHILMRELDCDQRPHEIARFIGDDEVHEDDEDDVEYSCGK